MHRKATEESSNKAQGKPKVMDGVDGGAATHPTQWRDLADGQGLARAVVARVATVLERCVVDPWKNAPTRHRKEAKDEIAAVPRARPLPKHSGRTSPTGKVGRTQPRHEQLLR